MGHGASSDGAAMSRRHAVTTRYVTASRSPSRRRRAASRSVSGADCARRWPEPVQDPTDAGPGRILHQGEHCLPRVLRDASCLLVH